jgi:hypothetical protein
MRLFRCTTCGVLRIEEKPDDCDIVYQSAPLVGWGSLRPERCGGKYEEVTFTAKGQNCQIQTWPR